MMCQVILCSEASTERRNKNMWPVNSNLKSNAVILSLRLIPLGCPSGSTWPHFIASCTGVILWWPIRFLQLTKAIGPVTCHGLLTEPPEQTLYQHLAKLKHISSNACSNLPSSLIQILMSLLFAPKNKESLTGQKVLMYFLQQQI